MILKPPDQHIVWPCKTRKLRVDRLVNVVAYIHMRFHMGLQQELTFVKSKVLSILILHVQYGALNKCPDLTMIKNRTEPLSAFRCTV